MTWVFADLSDNELREYAMGDTCACKTPEQTGTANGFRCNVHRARTELARRWVESQGWPDAHDILAEYR